MTQPVLLDNVCVCVCVHMCVCVGDEYWYSMFELWDVCMYPCWVEGGGGDIFFYLVCIASASDCTEMKSTARVCLYLHVHVRVLGSIGGLQWAWSMGVATVANKNTLFAKLVGRTNQFESVYWSQFFTRFDGFVILDLKILWFLYPWQQWQNRRITLPLAHMHGVKSTYTQADILTWKPHIGLEYR